MTPAARSAGAGVLLTAAVCFAGSFFGAESIAAEAVQAAIAEWGGGTLGVAWSDLGAPAPSLAAIAVRVLRGVIFGLGASALVVAVNRVTRGPEPAVPVLAIAALGLTLVDATLIAIRDELLLRGLVHRVADFARPGAARDAAALIASGLASSAWVLGNAASTGNGAVPLSQLVAEGLVGASLGALWLRDRGAWMPVAAHAAWAVVMRRNAEVLARWPASIALAVVCAAAVTWGVNGAASRENSASRSRVG